MTPAPPNAGPAVAPHGNPGGTMQGLAKIDIAMKALQEALPTIPMGTPLHESMMKAIKDVGTHMTEFKNSPQMKMQELLMMVQKAKAQQPNQALAGMAGGGQPPMPPAMAPPPEQPQMAA